MDAVVESIQGAELWQIGLADILVVAGSSAASAWISGMFSSRKDSKSFKREVRERALKIIGESYAVYLQYGNQASQPTLDAERDQRVAYASSTLEVAVAAIGQTDLLVPAANLVDLGELFASKDADTNALEVQAALQALIWDISEGIPES